MSNSTLLGFRPLRDTGQQAPTGCRHFDCRYCRLRFYGRHINVQTERDQDIARLAHEATCTRRPAELPLTELDVNALRTTTALVDPTGEAIPPYVAGAGYTREAPARLLVEPGHAVPDPWIALRRWRDGALVCQPRHTPTPGRICRWALECTELAVTAIRYAGIGDVDTCPRHVDDVLHSSTTLGALNRDEMTLPECWCPTSPRRKASFYCPCHGTNEARGINQLSDL